MKDVNKNLWVYSLLGLTGLLSLPIMSILASFTDFNGEVWGLLIETRLLELFINSMKLSMGVAFFTLILGVSLAWITTLYEFPFSKVFQWALILPLSMPAYVIGFVFLTSFDYGGLFADFNVEIRNIWGVTTVMSLVLYPYVYLMARSAFLEQSESLIRAARGLGMGRIRIFFKVALPLARPAILVGLALALMESLADFGTVALFSFDTFTTAIYEVWFGMFDRVAATQLAALLLLFNMLLFYIERVTRGQKQFYGNGKATRTEKSFKVTGAKGWLLFLYPFTILLIAFVYPVVILSIWAVKHIEESATGRFWELLGNTLMLGIVSGVIILFIALVLAYGKRLFPSKISTFATRIASMGYALPGSVIAVGVLVPFAALDHAINAVGERYFSYEPGLIFTGGLIGLIFAYVVRFMTAGFNALDASMEKITPNMDRASQSLGVGLVGTMKRVHFPLMKVGMLTGFIMVIVDVMKEMPATLLMRPFGFDTLATQVWQLSSEALAEEAALYALTIVLTGLIPVIFLIKLQTPSKEADTLEER